MESSAELVDIESGEEVEVDIDEGDYSSDVEELKREDMPKKIDEDLGEFEEGELEEEEEIDLTFTVKGDESAEEPFENGNDFAKSAEEEEKLVEMERRLSEANKKIEQLTRELSRTNTEVQKASSGRSSAPLVIRLINLKEKVATGESFFTDLDELEYFANGDKVILKTIDDIRKYSAGLKTKAFINDKFHESAIEVMKKHNAPADDASFFSKVIYSLTQHIVIRKTDETKELSTTEKILMDAEKLLDTEKYKEAVLEVIKLDSEYLEYFDEWVDETSEFVYVNEVLFQAIKYAEENK